MEARVTYRKAVMPRIRETNTAPELIVRQYLHAHGVRFNKNVRELPGKPDILISKFRVIIMINGCFWHGHDCSLSSKPKRNTAFWLEKIAKTKLRDTKSKQCLENLGWKVIVIWECDLEESKRSNTLQQLLADIKN